MNWLLWKDYRINRLVIFTGIVLLLVPHLIGLYAVCREAMGEHYRVEEGQRILFGTSIYSLVLSQFTVALLGGNAIASERVDRSAEFLHSLPYTRGKILASKLILPLIVTAVIWLNALLIWHVVHSTVAFGRLGDAPEIYRGVFYTAITGLTFFCVAWFLSSLITSPAIATCGGLIAPLVVVGSILFVGYLFNMPEIDRLAGPWYCGICLTLAPACFAIGTWHYLRRVEP
jgi:ABC-type transport system involved in multi-copper enzyme maturation permease subunit